MTVVYPTCRAAVVLKSVIETFGAGSRRAQSRKARVAFAHLLGGAGGSIEPDLSSTSITLMPQRGGRFVFGPGP